MGFPIQDRPQFYDVPNQPCTQLTDGGNYGSQPCTIINFDPPEPQLYDVPNQPCTQLTDGDNAGSPPCTIIDFDPSEQPAVVYPMNFNRPNKPNAFAPETGWLPFNPVNPNDLSIDENDNCQREIPMLVVKPLSQRYIFMSTTAHLMGAQRFYKKTNEMFIRLADGSIRETLKDYFARISSGNVDNIPPPVVFTPEFVRGGGGSEVVSPGLMVGSREAQ